MGRRKKDVSCGGTQEVKGGNTGDVGCGAMGVVSCGRIQAVGWGDAEEQYVPDEDRSSLGKESMNCGDAKC